MSQSGDVDNAVLHVIVVGFHHKKGCQVEYSYPPLIAGNAVNSCEIPDKWKHLPSLALPDGSHNFANDTVFFHLPSLDVSHTSTVYAVSCYRQIDSKCLVNREAEVTRNSVQKSVCVLSRLPLYGLIEAKLELITHAYFDEGDFRQVSLLQETYKNLNSSLNPDLVRSSQVFLGLSCRELVSTFRHQVLVLFKLLLLERRVLFFSSPVRQICASLLTLISLFPGMIECGLGQCVRDGTWRPLASTVKHVSASSDIGSFVEVDFAADESSSGSETNGRATSSSSSGGREVSRRDSPGDRREEDVGGDESAKAEWPASRSHVPLPADIAVVLPTASRVRHATEPSPVDDASPVVCRPSPLRSLSDSGGGGGGGQLGVLVDTDVSWPTDGRRLQLRFKGDDGDATATAAVITPGDAAAAVADDIPGVHSPRRRAGQHRRTTDQFGFPLAVFTKGNILHPYLSLYHCDALDDAHGYVIGASNIMFKQKRHLVDVIVEMTPVKVDVIDAELRRQLTLSTADLRFADFLVQHVADDTGNVFTDDTSWVGGDEWIRAQFKLYIVSLLASVDDEKLADEFNASFVNAWKRTGNFQAWTGDVHSALSTVTPGHLCSGQLSMADMKLRLLQVMQTTERGKKINAAVNQTGRAVGGAITSAKGMLSSWMQKLGRDWSNGEQPPT